MCFGFGLQKILDSKKIIFALPGPRPCLAVHSSDECGGAWRGAVRRLGRAPLRAATPKIFLACKMFRIFTKLLNLVAGSGLAPARRASVRTFPGFTFFFASLRKPAAPKSDQRRGTAPWLTQSNTNIKYFSYSQQMYILANAAILSIFCNHS